MRTLITGLSVLVFSLSVYVTILAIRIRAPGEEAALVGTPIPATPPLPAVQDAGGAFAPTDESTPDLAAELERTVRDLREELALKEEESFKRLSREQEAGQTLVAELSESIEELQEKLAAKDDEAIAHIAREQEASRTAVTELQETITGIREELEALREKGSPPPEPAVSGAARQPLSPPMEGSATLPGEGTGPSEGGDGGRVIAILGGGLFQSGQDGLSDDIERAVEKTLPDIVSHPGYRIVVEGHSDNIPVERGGEKGFSDNLTLSRLRAGKVARFLESQGVEAERIVVVGYGDSRPLAPNRTSGGRAENRRVEIRLLPPETAGTEE